MKSLEMREKFFAFFQRNGHEKVTSSSLIPADDPTLLFANAGMNQFKDLFLGKEKRSYKRAVTIQKCVRAGGKHNDLDNVGLTKRHLTFFEMMGNFSFGDYFKKDAIRFAWEFLTKEVGIPADRLVVTVFRDDDEAYDIWHKEIGVPTGRIFRCGEKDNFWAMGDTGPCGPCSEILYDRNPEDTKPVTDPNADDVRFLEIWNNVFMQFNRQKDGATYKLVPLTQTGIDTGMGLERLALVLQDKDSVYETDLFMPVIKKIEELTGLVYESQPDDKKAAFRVLADHIRSSCLIIADGGTPSNEGRGYVLRKIIRRAALFEQKISEKPIFHLLADAFIDFMGEIYPELRTHRKLIVTLLKNEVNKFTDNLRRGQLILEKYLAAQQKTKKLTGEQAFKLYDTYGFPYEVTELAARERGYAIDKTSFDLLMEKQRAQSGQKTQEAHITVELPATVKTEFVGYASLQSKASILALIKDNALVDSVKENDECWLVPDKTPFYAESGGQVADEGTIAFGDEIVPILDLQKIGHAVALKIHAPVTIKKGQNVNQQVDECRQATMKNHTATHLLQTALLQVCGATIKQTGSLVTHDYLRFDFNYTEQLDLGMIKDIEDFVNEKIWHDVPVTITTTTLEKAKAKGVIAHFGEKYNPECVCMVEVGDVSKELCGGTHVTSTGEIGLFKIMDVSAVSAGTRRITAVTGPKALELFQSCFITIKGMSQEFKVPLDMVYETVEQQVEQIKEAYKQLKTLKKQLVHYQAADYTKQLTLINNIPFLAIDLADNSELDELREMALALVQLKEGCYCITSKQGQKFSFVAAISPSLKTAANLQDFAKLLQEKSGIRSGGTPAIIQGGGALTGVDIGSLIKQWLMGIK
jgi:alanyl-tRNA synthetase